MHQFIRQNVHLCQHKMSTSRLTLLLLKCVRCGLLHLLRSSMEEEEFGLGVKAVAWDLRTGFVSVLCDLGLRTSKGFRCLTNGKQEE